MPEKRYVEPEADQKWTRKEAPKIARVVRTDVAGKLALLSEDDIEMWVTADHLNRLYELVEPANKAALEPWLEVTRENGYKYGGELYYSKKDAVDAMVRAELDALLNNMTLLQIIDRLSTDLAVRAKIMKVYEKANKYMEEL